mmetsp:Transcript_21352/g.59285  ORF Transcript_21352/g.59285 Transcript_21352/m.59285 type:complete len:418 (-) Transcript_21352:32-1285(-)
MRRSPVLAYWAPAFGDVAMGVPVARAAPRLCRRKAVAGVVFVLLLLLQHTPESLAQQGLRGDSSSRPTRNASFYRRARQAAMIRREQRMAETPQRILSHVPVQRQASQPQVYANAAPLPPPVAVTKAEILNCTEESGRASPPSSCDCAPETLMSMRESNGFFCDNDISWQLRKFIAKAQQPHQERTSPGGMRALYQENWEPNFSCTHERRLGQPGDGGKWICDPHKLKTRTGCLIYSFGSENKFDFEQAVLQHIGVHCEVHTFDHTIGLSPSRRPEQVNFHPWGLGIPLAGDSLLQGAEQPFKGVGHRPGLLSLAQIVTELGHWDRQIAILKIDVEGAEFNALPQLLQDGTFERLQIQQVQIEIHRDQPHKVHNLLRAFYQAGYAIFHKEPNIQYPMSPGDVCVEYAFVRLNKEFWQ